MKNGTKAPWMRVVRGDPLPWLLQKGNPCVRYRTLLDLLGRPTFADYPFPYERAHERRVRDEWNEFGMQRVLAGLVGFAEARRLQVGWRWGLVLSPEHCPEWCTALVRWVPRKGDRLSWPVARVYFMTRAGQFTPEGVAQRLGVGVEDEREKARFNKFFWRALWRVRVAHWKGDYDEVAVTLRDPREFRRLKPLLAEALKGVKN